MNVSTAPLPEPSLLAQTDLSCFHCHDHITPSAKVVFDQKNFCCEGCRTVYEILNANGLCTFYDLADAPGLSQKTRKDAGAWAFLDDPEVREKLLQFSDGTTARATFLLPAVHCASCIWLLEQLWRMDEGITSSRVDFLKKAVAVQFDEQKTSLRKIAALLAALGYPPELNLGDLSPSARPVDKSIFYKIGQQHLIDGRNKPGYDLLCKVFEIYPNVSRDWLLLGRGPMLVSGEHAPKPAVFAPPVVAGPHLNPLI